MDLQETDVKLMGQMKKSLLKNSVRTTKGQLLAEWTRARTESNFVYFLNHRHSTTQWDHPEYIRIFDDMSAMNNIRYAAYRMAFKLRHIQIRFKFQDVNLHCVTSAFDCAGFKATENSKMASCIEIERVILYIFRSTYKCKPIDFTLFTDLVMNFVLNVFDENRSGNVQVLKCKVLLVMLCGGRLQEKYRYFFNQLVNQDNLCTRKRLGKFLLHLAMVAEFLSERLSFGVTLVPAALHSCFKDVDDGITEEQFLSWFTKEPQTLVWLTTLYRVAASESVVHDVKCSSCKRRPVKGFRYQCLKCIVYNLCQSCFLHGRKSKNHKLCHPIQEYCVESTVKDWRKSVCKIVRHKMKKTNSVKPRYLGISVDPSKTLGSLLQESQNQTSNENELMSRTIIYEKDDNLCENIAKNYQNKENMYDNVSNFAENVCEKDTKFHKNCEKMCENEPESHVKGENLYVNDAKIHNNVRSSCENNPISHCVNEKLTCQNLGNIFMKQKISKIIAEKERTLSNNDEIEISNNLTSFSCKIKAISPEISVKNSHEKNVILNKVDKLIEVKQQPTSPFRCENSINGRQISNNKSFDSEKLFFSAPPKQQIDSIIKELECNQKEFLSRLDCDEKQRNLIEQHNIQLRMQIDKLKSVLKNISISNESKKAGLARMESTPILGERGLNLTFSPIVSQDFWADLDNKENHLVENRKFNKVISSTVNDSNFEQSVLRPNSHDNLRNIQNNVNEIHERKKDKKFAKLFIEWSDISSIDSDNIENQSSSVRSENNSKNSRFISTYKKSDFSTRELNNELQKIERIMVRKNSDKNLTKNNENLENLLHFGMRDSFSYCSNSWSNVSSKKDGFLWAFKEMGNAVHEYVEAIPFLDSQKFPSNSSNEA